MDDHYATLRIQPNASRQEIVRAYRRLARLHHPDLLGDASLKTRQQAETTLKRINVAYRIIGDPQRRALYDRERAARDQRAAARRGGTTAATPRPVMHTSEHWAGGGPLTIEWAEPPTIVPARPKTDIFSFRRLLIGSLLIVVFTLALALVWRPVGEPGTVLALPPAAASTPSLPTVTPAR